MLAIFAALDGVVPSLTPPSTVMPCSISDARNAPVTKRAGSSTTYTYRLGPAREPIVPDTTMLPSPNRRTERRAPVPATVRTLLVRGIEVVAGSSFTPLGEIVTQTRFSLSESADTRAAYPDWRYRLSHPSGTS